MTEPREGKGPRFFVKVPESLVDALHEGEISGAMLVTMVILHRQADWQTGTVKSTSAGTLVTWSNKAYSERIFSEALRRLELIGHITRVMKRGSHKNYPCILNNYEASVRVPRRGEDGKPLRDGDGRVVFVTKLQMINPIKIKPWAEVQNGRCDERCDGASDEGWDEGTDEGTDECSDEGWDTTSLDEAQSQSGRDCTSRNESVSPSVVRPAGGGRTEGLTVPVTNPNETGGCDKGRVPVSGKGVPRQGDFSINPEPVPPVRDAVMPPAQDTAPAGPPPQPAGTPPTDDAWRVALMFREVLDPNDAQRVPNSWAEEAQEWLDGLGGYVMRDVLNQAGYALHDLPKKETKNYRDPFPGWLAKIKEAYAMGKDPVRFFRLELARNDSFRAYYSRWSAELRVAMGDNLSGMPRDEKLPCPPGLKGWDEIRKAWDAGRGSSSGEEIWEYLARNKRWYKFNAPRVYARLLEMGCFLGREEALGPLGDAFTRSCEAE